MKDLFLETEKNGTQTVLNIIKKNKLELEQDEHIIKVIDFCNLLEILSNASIENRRTIFLELQISSKKQKINNKQITIDYIAFAFKDSNHNNINRHIKNKYPSLYSLVNDYMLKFYNLNINFINPNHKSTPILRPLTESGIEEIKEKLLNKEMHISYQHYKLHKILNKNNINENIIKV